MGIPKSKWILFVIVFLIACAVLGVFKWYGTSPADLSFGSTAPLFSLSDTEGKIVSVKQLRGKPVFVSFVATWCTQCSKALAVLQEFSIQQKDAAILSITIGESEEVVNEFVKYRSITYPVLLDKSGKVAERYQVRAVPDLWVLNADGTIWGHFTGPINIELLQNIVTIMGD